MLYGLSSMPITPYSLLLLTSSLTMPIQIQTMMINSKIQKITHSIFYLLNSRITKFNNLSTLHTDQVIVLLEAMGFFVLCEVFSKLVLRDEIAMDQELKSIVHSSATDPVI